MKKNEMRFGDFTGLAKNYSKYRPDYSNSVLEDLLLLVGKGSCDIEVVDVGAGTGIWTRMVYDKDVKTVKAVENCDDMRKQGIIDSGGKNLKWIKGSAEKTNLNDDSCDWITMASSFHWADFDLATKELYRILRPGGYFTALWNPRIIESNPMFVEIEKYLYTLKPNIKRVSSGLSGIGNNFKKKLANSPYFENVIYLQGKHIIKMSPSRYIGCWRSVNDLQVQLGTNKFSIFLEYVEKKIKNLETVEVSYLTRAWTACRKNS